MNDVVRRFSGEIVSALSCLLILACGFLYRCSTHVEPASAERSGVPPPLVAFVERANSFPDLKAVDAASGYSIDAIEQHGKVTTVAGGRSTTSFVDRSSPVVFAGWAVDSPAKANAAGVYVLIDGHRRFAAVYGSARPDVATAIGMPGANDCGFAVAIPELSLSVGRHTVGIEIVNANATQIYRQTTPISLLVSG